MSQISCCTLARDGWQNPAKWPVESSQATDLIHDTPSPPSINLLLLLLPFLLFERLLQRNPKIVLLYALHVL